MKKLLVLLTVIFSLGLMGCESTPTPSVYDDTTLQTQITDINLQLDELENYNDVELQVKYLDLQLALDTFLDSYIEYEEYNDRDILIELVELDLAILELQNRLDNLTSVTGLNGNVSYYENEQTGLFALSATIIQLKDTFDKTKAPAYLLDDDENYVSFEQLALLLKAKYFSEGQFVENSGGDSYDMGSKAYIRFVFSSELSDEEVLARMVLMIEELRLYEFYVLSCPELIIHIYNYKDYDHQIRITIPLVVVINDFFEITLDGIYSNDYEMTLETFGLQLNQETSQQYYDDFVLNETFNGYVLNYIK